MLTRFIGSVDDESFYFIHEGNKHEFNDEMFQQKN